LAQLCYKYGSMGSSKSANALMTAFNYKEKDKHVWLIKPALDTRDDAFDDFGNRIAIVKSRIGLSEKAYVVSEKDDILYLLSAFSKCRPIDVIIVDECQFLTEDQVDQLKLISSYHDIPVICFGLRSDFRSKLFAGSQRLFELADEIEEITSICKCGAKSIINARFDKNGYVVTEGEVIELGGNEKYEGLCWWCWQKAIAQRDALMKT